MLVEDFYVEIDSKKFADVQLNRVVSPLVNLDESEELNDNPKAAKNLSGNPLRPQTFADYPGQEKVKNNLEIFVRAAKLRKHTLDHVLLHGPPGLGKTTLAHILANEMQVPFYNTSGPSIDKPGDLVGILMSLEKNSLLFIDEIHRLSIQVEEVLYSAMEDFYVDIIIGQGQASRSMRMDIAPFTLVGATTRVSLLSRPLQNRFGIQERLEFYRLDALVEIIKRNCT
ncbi:MAG: AAA family ATPase, partial [Oligoflexales bacterium]|nr:AAA family ATPase [Oligoflexales bacterium]